MKKLFLHMGVPKTGSSTIEHFLTASSETLSKQGVLYPVSARLGAHGKAHHVLPYSLLKNYPAYVPREWQKSRDSVMSDLLAEIHGSDLNTVILSSEAFTTAGNDETVAWLSRQLSMFDVRVVAYVRRPDRYFESRYGQSVKAGHFMTATADEFIDSQKISFVPAVLAFADRFGDDRMIVRLFERKELTGGDVLQDFLGILGIDIGLVELEPQHRINESPSRHQIELLRRINAEVTLDAANRRRLSRLLRDYFAEHGRHDRMRLFDDGQRARVMARFGQSYRELLDRFGLPDN